MGQESQSHALRSHAAPGAGGAQRADYQGAGCLVEILGNAWALSESFQDEFKAGANEIDLVRSGLDDTMRKAFQEMRAVLQEKDGVNDFRTAAYLVAIEKIAESYRIRGH